MNFCTNLNQSFVRQPQIRFTGTLAPGLTGQVSLEMPDTQYTSVAGVFTQISTPAGFAGLSPAFTSVPDLLGRLEYRNDGLGLDLRGLLRDLTIRTAGTAAAPPPLKRDTVGWGVAGSGRFPMRWLSPAFGPDELVGMAYYGQGIGRYFGANTFGQDALSNIGLPGVVDVTLDALPTYGASVGYRRFWTPQLRSNFVYSYAWQQYPSYGLFFVPGSASATLLNSTMQQAIVNLIWSPFAELRGNSWGPDGWMLALNMCTPSGRVWRRCGNRPGRRRLCHRQPRSWFRHCAVLKPALDWRPKVRAATGSFIAFATAPDNIAHDGTGKNSPFTAALVTHMTTPGISINDVMITVRRDVLKATGGRQEPWDQSKSSRALSLLRISSDQRANRGSAATGVCSRVLRRGTTRTGCD